MTSEQNFRQIFVDLKQKGKMTSPRGLPVIEIENYTYELPARVRFCNFEARKLNLDYIKREFLWYLRGNKHDLSILKYAKMWENLVTPDQSINSNYGQYIFNVPTEVTYNQFDFVVNQLIEDRDSRRASISILKSSQLIKTNKDVPCTYSLNFRIRESRLNMSVHMRSQDAVFGMGNDAPCFSFIHEMVWAALTKQYPDLEMGSYHHIADSFHVYDRHFEVMEKIAEGDKYIPIECPVISNADEVKYLQSQIHGTYDEEYFSPAIRPRYANPQMKEELSDILKFYQKSIPFSNWLTSFDKP
jgi:thymidylate synthase